MRVSDDEPFGGFDLQLWESESSPGSFITLLHTPHNLCLRLSAPPYKERAIADRQLQIHTSAHTHTDTHSVNRGQLAHRQQGGYLQPQLNGTIYQEPHWV